MSWPDVKPLVGARVLVVDDEPDTLEVFSLSLEAAGAEVRTAKDVKAAFEVTHDWTPTVVLSDLSMPGADGFSCLQQLRAVDRLAKAPAIAISGIPAAEARLASLVAGFQAYVGKPVLPEQLVAVVAAWMYRTR